MSFQSATGALLFVSEGATTGAVTGAVTEESTGTTTAGAATGPVSATGADADLGGVLSKSGLSTGGGDLAAAAGAGGGGIASGVRTSGTGSAGAARNVALIGMGGGGGSNPGTYNSINSACAAIDAPMQTYSRRSLGIMLRAWKMDIALMVNHKI